MEPRAGTPGPKHNLVAHVEGDSYNQTIESRLTYLVKNTGTPAWLYWQTRQKELEQAKKGVEPFASYLKAGEDGVIPISRFAERLTLGVPVNAFGVFPQSRTPIEIIVTGGGTNTYWSGGDFTCSGSASIDKWR